MKVKLNLGCGDKIKKSTENEKWINLDFRKMDGVEVVCDLETEPLPFKDAEIDYILADDILEHFIPKTLLEILLDGNRVLKEGGELEIKTPDLEKIISAYPDTIDSYEFDRKIFGGRDYEGNQHKIGFTKESIQFYLSATGFKIDKIENMGLGDWSNMKILAHKPFKDKWNKTQIKAYSKIGRSRDILETQRAKLIINLICKQNPESMLDLGVHDGWLERGLRKKGYTKFIVGQDLSEVIEAYDYSDIENFKAVKRDVDEGITLEHYEAVCAFEILEHIFNPYKFLKQIRKTNGILYLSTPNGEEASLKHNDHFGWFDLRRLQLLLNFAGFELQNSYNIEETETLFIVAKPI